MDTHHVTLSPEAVVRAGVDVSSQGGLRVGPDVSYRWAFLDDGARFAAFAIGGHVRFGSR